MATLNSGSHLGPYEIVSSIGQGGMGQVYRARDSRLNRTVAIKVLSDQVSNASELKQRFEREAQTVAALNHPYICTLFDVGHDAGIDYLVMEYLDGETVAQRLERGRMPVDQVLKYAIQIADALDKAHRQGVTHRDLKPSNIMITKSGAKLLDFGLAKLRQDAQAPTALSALPTNAAMTAQGTILGTLQYMSPEQVEGLEADARSDIFAFGALLYEMVTGRKTFEGKSQASIIAAILDRDPPPISSIEPMTPRHLDHVVRRCLAKAPEERWQTALDLQMELKWIAEEPPETLAPVAAPLARSSSLSLTALLIIITAVVSAGAAWMLKPVGENSGTSISRLSVALASDEVMGDLDTPNIALSADGTKLAYVAVKENVTRLYLRALDSLESKPLAGTEGASNPFFSPNGEWIGFFANAKLKKVSVTGGTVQNLANASNPRGGTWGPDDMIYFAPTPVIGISKVAASGGEPQQVTSLDRTKGEVSHRLPQILPDGKTLIFTVWTGPGSDERHVHAQNLESGERHVLISGGDTGRYISTGHLAYVRNDTLMAVPLDLAALRVTGAAPTPLAETPRSGGEGSQWAFSDSGIVAYVSGDPNRNNRRLVWVDRRGNVEPVPAPPQRYDNVVLSPDARSAAVEIDSGTIVIWLYDFARGTLNPLTRTGSSQSPAWTPDGKHVVYRGTRMGFRNLFWKTVDGTTDEERLAVSETVQTPASSSPDGKWLAYTDTVSETGHDLWLLPLDGDRKPQLLLGTPAAEFNPHFSPDGRWIAFPSDESGRTEVYVMPVTGPKTKTQISTMGGDEPLWARNGRELFYLNGNKMMAVDISTQPTLTAGTPRILFEGTYVLSPTGNTSYSISEDGQRFLRVQAVQSEQPSRQINIVLNWLQELKQKAR